MGITVKIKKLNKNAQVPSFGSAFAAGADLYACIDHTMIIQPGQTCMIPTGFAMEIPAGYAGLIFARSGMASKRGLAPANKVGVIDCDYRGEVMVALHNHSSEEAAVDVQERVAQLVIMPVPEVVFEEADELQDTVRGEGGFGSTGTK